MPSPFVEKYRKDYDRYGGVIMNKLKHHSTKKTAFELGFLKGQALALGTEEGFKWAKLNYERRKKINESKGGKK